jgi:phytoene dehydrogenase-like protein
MLQGSSIILSALSTCCPGPLLAQGAAYPVGGSSEIAFALCNTITAGGGAVLVRAPVERIVLDPMSSRVTGVVIARDGSVVSAPVVISDAGESAPPALCGVGVYLLMASLLRAPCRHLQHLQ